MQTSGSRERRLQANKTNVSNHRVEKYEESEITKVTGQESNSVKENNKNHKGQISRKLTELLSSN